MSEQRLKLLFQKFDRLPTVERPARNPKAKVNRRWVIVIAYT